MVHHVPAARTGRGFGDAVARQDESIPRTPAAISASTLLSILVHDRRRARPDRSLVEPRAGRRIRATDHARSALAIAFAATHADDHAHWKLKPPIRPSTSSISPIRYSPSHTLDSIVAESISDS